MPSASVTRYGPKKVSDWHRALSDELIANPSQSRKNIAKKFDVSQSWLSMVTNSDAFREYHLERRAALSNAVQDRVTAGLVPKIESMTETAVEVIGERLETEETKITTRDLTNVVKLGMESLGFLTRNPAATVSVGIHNTTITNNDGRTVNVQDGAALEVSKQRLIELRKASDAELALDAKTVVEVDVEASHVY